MPSLHVLVIDDEPAARDVLASAVMYAGYSVDVAVNVRDATAKLSHGDVDVALCDIQLPDGTGIDVLKQSRATGLDTSFVIVTAFASVETAVEALRAGAYDYIIKPVRHTELLHRLSQIETMRGLRQENRALRKAVRQTKPLYRFTSTAMRKVERLVDKIAETNDTVLVTGESGTGKTVVARTIHERSARRESVFLPVNCGAIPDQLLESELFGHIKGAFTSADRGHKGLFVEADNGTLFLDEINELPLHMQTKLLHVIEEKQVRPVGSAQMRRVDVRIIVATNRDLAECVREGKFREDLYFRLSMFEIAIPALRERPDDIRGLIHFTLAANQRAKGVPRAIELDVDAEQVLLRHSWPGNVRELENVINRACILVEGDSITVDELPSEMVDTLWPRPVSGSTNAATESLHDQRRRFEGEIIRRAIQEAGGDRRLAARRLCISLSGLYSKLSGSESEHELRGAVDDEHRKAVQS